VRQDERPDREEDDDDRVRVLVEARARLARRPCRRRLVFLVLAIESLLVCEIDTSKHRRHPIGKRL
jgi:hypothetical protein